MEEQKKKIAELEEIVCREEKTIEDLMDKLDNVTKLYEDEKLTTKEQLEELVELRAQVEYSRHREAELRGTIEGLKFAIRCDGVSGAEVR